MTPRAQDVVVVGAGPAGTSAALALTERGRGVLLLEAGGRPAPPPGSEGSYLDLRAGDPHQWRWQLGGQFESFGIEGAVSPKLRVPGLRSVFEGFAEANRLRTEGGFCLVGALAEGGLSNAWGCGVARFDAAELGAIADDASLERSYERVARRMGVSGASPDALSGYFGLDQWADPALPLDPLHAAVWKRAHSCSGDDFRLGRARVAVLSRAREDRAACDLRGMCLWGCRQQATWSAVHDLERLRRSQFAEVRSHTLVTALRRDGDAWVVHAMADGAQPVAFRAKQVVLAAGTIATTRLALAAMVNPPACVRLLSNPMAAFLLLQPSMLGRSHTSAFGLAQLSFALDGVGGADVAFGNLFSTSGLPVNEFLPYLPVTRRAGLPLLRSLLPATMAGNVFLPGKLSRHEMRLLPGNGMNIRAGSDTRLSPAYEEVARRLRRAFRRLGAWMLPGSFTPAAPGADLHYAGTLPISHQPRAHECRLNGEIAGLPGIFVVDGACLPDLPAKAHTLTIAANADRIARQLP